MPTRQADDMTPSWTEVEQVLRAHMEAVVNNDPRILLEVDGGPVSRTADIILATLYGLDEQVDEEMRLHRVEPVLLRAIPQRLSIALPEDDMTAMTASSFKTAEYRLQSSYATLNVSPLVMPLPDDVKVGPPEFLASVLWVRYKRRSL